MFCRHCGATLNDDAKFCIRCGKSVLPGVTTLPAAPVEPSVFQADPAEPSVFQAAPAGQLPEQPAPIEPMPIQPAFFEPLPVQPSPIEPLPVQPSEPVVFAASPGRPGSAVISAQPIAAPGASPMNNRPKNKGMKKSSLIILIAVAVLLVIGVAAGALFVLRGLDGNNGSGDKDGNNAVTLKDGTVSYKDVILDFGDNDAPQDVSLVISDSELGSEEKPDGLASELYDLDIDPAYTEPVTITIPYTEDLSELDEEAEPMLGIGSLITFDDGSQETIFQYIEAEMDDEASTVTATFIPSEVLGDKYVRGSSKGTSTAVTPSREHVRAGIFWCSTTFTDGGHFLVYFPAQAFKYFIDYKDREALLTDLEAVYSDYLAKGYLYAKRTDWPIVVNIKSLDDDAAYIYGYGGSDGTININKKFFEGGYNATEVKPLIAHEFFHFVQLNYVTYDNGCPWFDEATATYYESQVKGAIPSIVNQYKELIFGGVFPEENTAGNGYSRMPLIEYIATNTSSDFIKAAYSSAGSGVDWPVAIKAVAGDPAEWAGEFYSALIKGEVGDYTPYTLHSNLAKGSMTEVGTKIDLAVPTADEIKEAAENGENPTLGQATVSVASYGAQLVAITIDAEELKLLPDGADPIVKVSGGNADVRAYAIKSREVAGFRAKDGEVTLKDFKKATGDKKVFLVMVTGLQASGKTDYTVTVEIAPFPTLDELVGEYTDGTMTITTVFISDNLKSQMTPPAEEVTEDPDNPLAGIGCDLDMVAILESLVGQVNPMKIVIEKTGEDAGILKMISAEPDPDAAEAEEPTPIPFVYDPGTGTLTFDYALEGQVMSGTIAAAYGPDRKTVTLNGTLRMTAEGTPESDFYIDVQIAGSKPLTVQ